MWLKLLPRNFEMQAIMGFQFGELKPSMLDQAAMKISSRAVVYWLGDFPNAFLFDTPVNNALGREKTLWSVERLESSSRTFFPECPAAPERGTQVN
jgi:hypothetical protein